MRPRLPRRRHSLPRRLRRTLRYCYIKVVRINDSPRKVALGLALGVFLGIFPTFGIGFLFAILLATLFRWNKAAALLGGLVMNPITSPFFWSLSATLGGVIVFHGGDELTGQVVYIRDEVELLWEFLRFRNTDLLYAQLLSLLNSLTLPVMAYLVGNTIVSLAGAAVAYVLCLKGLVAHKERRRVRQRARVTASAAQRSDVTR
ncbi:MAG: DUF2062 domain-containing protein [Deltaproteobacteria bacterium]|nr:DUF2062 domain-containing protein [Deltaproteobacteria bacterium]